MIILYLIKNKQNGFTLVEVIVSMAILSILAVTFLMTFTTGFTNIFASGNKNEAMTLASDKLELLYAKQPISDDDIVSLTDSDIFNGKFIEENHDALYEYDKDFDYDEEGAFNFTVEAKELGYKVTIVSFYQNAERYVTLTSFVRGEN